MNDKELADAVVALGVGADWGDNFPGRYRLGITYTLAVDAYAFVRDWRVAGALMEMCDMSFVERLNATTWACRADHEYGDRTREWYENNSLPRAIIEACVEALT